VGKENALGVTGRSRRVANGGEIVWGGRYWVEDMLGPVREKVGEGRD